MAWLWRSRTHTSGSLGLSWKSMGLSKPTASLKPSETSFCAAITGPSKSSDTWSDSYDSRPHDLHRVGRRPCLRPPGPEAGRDVRHGPEPGTLLGTGGRLREENGVRAVAGNQGEVSKDAG